MMEEHILTAPYQIVGSCRVLVQLDILQLSNAGHFHCTGIPIFPCVQIKLGFSHSAVEWSPQTHTQTTPYDRVAEEISDYYH